jgi:hypothetical protein
MIQTGFDSRVKVYQVIENQLPSFILDENPKASEFLKQYYISQEHQSGSIDIAENLDQYLKLDNLTPEIIVDNTYLTSGIGTNNKITINVNSTKGFPKQYGLLKIGDEIITYTGITTNSFLNCQRGFSGITSYHQELNQEELLFETSSAESHEQSAAVQNLSSLFLKEFYKKLKYSLTPGLEDIDFVSDLNVGNFIKEARSFYKSKGTDESFKILFKVLYGVNATVVNLENFLIKPSSAEFVRRKVVLIEEISGEPNKLSGQTIEKSTDPDTNASVSEVEVVTRNGKKYYKLSLFVGYDDSPTVQGEFDVTPSTKCLESVPVGSSVISVDSTIGFPESGTIISGTNTITYTGKSVNQFFGCSGVESQIDQADNIRTDDVYIGYEDGDKTKKVEFRILGSLSDFIQVSESLSGVSEGDFVYIKSLGNAVGQTKFGEKNFKEVLVNSWFYNSNSRYHIQDFSGPKSLNLKSPIDRTSLKYGDEIEIVERGTSNVVFTTYVNEEIQDNSKSIQLFAFIAPNPNANYDLRRKVSKASSLNVPLIYGNDSIISDVSNVYTDNDYAYVASNSLPANNRGLSVPYCYQITKNLSGNYIDNSIGILTGKVDDDFTIISFPDNVPFLTGDRIFYQPEEDSLVGLETGSYYVKVLDSNKKEIQLYSSQSFVGSSNYLTFDSPYISGIGTHRFTLYSQRSAEIGPQKILKKFPLTNNIFNGSNEKTLPGPVGLLVNGVEIDNYKSLDKIYYGPLNSVKVLNSGENYDVINLPFISVSTGIGSTAFIQPVVSGSIQKTYVENQDFDIQNIVSIGVSGGNGFGAVLEPIVKKRVREVFFDARTTTNSGGINTTTRQLTFLTKHNFVDGEEVIYSSNGNLGVGIGVGNSTLIDNSQYYIKTTSDLTVRLYQSLSDYSSGINTVGFNTDNTSGIHKFYTSSSRNTLTEIKVVDGGQQYTNRKLIVKPTDISTSNHTINFKNHGFNDGDLIKYSYQTSSISGVSIDTSTSFYVLKVNDNSFRICDAGIGGITKSNYERKNYVRFSSVGSGYQYFSYPEISVFVEFTTPNGISTTQTIQITPKVRGKIIDAYLYESGTGYGSSILNFEKKPIITIQNGKDAKIVPNIINGTINSAKIEYGGKEYYSDPDIIVEDPTGTGSGAELVPTISGGRIANVTVTNSGIGYSTSSKIKVVPAGSNALFDVSIRDLTINNTKRFNSEIYTETLDNKLKYLVSGYFDTLQNCFADNGTFHSKIIGWAYDGNPIYGAYGYSTPENTESIRLLTSSYILDTSYLDRPFGFDAGFFIEDYRYDGSGDLDIHNGRFCKTPEFPNGIYAYFSPIDNINSESKFPYFIGDSYRSNTLIENSSLDQSFDFGSSDLLRNTYPYKLIDPNIENDFIPSYLDLKNQLLTVNSIASGVISGFDIVNSGSDYKVNDLLAFTNADDIGISAKVSSLNGKEVENVVTSTETYNNTIVSWNNQNQAKITILPYHSLKDNDYVTLSGFSTNLTTLDGFYKIGVSSQYSTVTRDIPQATSIGSTEVYVSQIPNAISVGSSIGIGTETLKVLGIFKNENILKVQRGLTGAGSSHIASSTISVFPNSFTITSNLDYFDSKVNDKVFFNPRESVGVGTTLGTSSSVSFNFGDSTVIRDIPVKGIYLENHPFVTNQKVLFTIPSGNISVSTNGSSTYLIPTSGTSQEFYVVNKSINLVGLKTSFTAPELFFHGNGDDNDEYSIESMFNQIKGTVQRYKTTVSVSTAHELLNGDAITLNVNPNLNVGIGTSTSVRILYNTEYGKLIINPIGFGSENVIRTKQYYTIPTRQSTIDTAVGIAFTSKAISPLATRNAQQIYDYIWDNYSKFDVDGDGVVSDVDGLIIIREMSDPIFAGDALTSGITFPLGATRTTASSIRSYISSVTGGVGIGSTIGTAPFSSCYDIDGHGSVGSLNDGIMIYRFAVTPGLGAGGFYSPSTLRGSFEIVNHGLKTGDKVLYLNNTTSALKPVDSGEYFVHRNNDNSFQLGLTYKDVVEDPINPVSIAYTGVSNQSISLINPPIQVIKNNSLKFDLSNSSLTGYKLKIYYDKDFKNEFVSTGSSTSFNISGLGTVGVSTTASLTLSYSENLPSKLYYNLEKSGYISTTDSNVVNYSQIEFIDSFYDNNYIISGVGTTTFSVYLEKSPERVSYAKTECDNLEYFTSSLNAKGSIKEIGIISKGSSSKNIPIITEINSTDGMNANVFCKTKNIGDIKELGLINEGFEYPSDPTLQPTAYISPQIAIKAANTIGVVTVTSGGSEYINPPSIVIVNTLTGEKIDSGILEASLSGSSISAVKVLQDPKGVPDTEVNLFATNNTNGFSIQQVQSSSTGIFTCFISKPTGGFTPNPFEVGDEVFIEGIKKESTDGDGFNSEEYGYQFFNVTGFDDTTELLAKIVINVSELTANTGIAKTIQDFIPTIINRKTYPIFEFSKKKASFIIGEKIISNEVERDLKIVGYNDSFIKVVGSYELSIDETFKGKESGTIATVESIKENIGRFKINFSSDKNIGWSNNIGILNDDAQVIPDNDYYQNLSYTIKSPITYDEFKTPVNNLLHSVGTKNFSDTGITSTTSVGIGSENVTTIIRDIIEEQRVDTIYNFDLSKDIDAVSGYSKFLKLENKILTPFINNTTNNVLKLDDINRLFSNLETSPYEFLNLINLKEQNSSYINILVRVTSSDNTEIQLSDLIILNDGTDISILEKGTLVNSGIGLTHFSGENLGDFSIEENEFKEVYLRFTPANSYEKDYDLKWIQSYFDANTIGIASTSIGFVKLFNSIDKSSPGITTNIVSLASTSFESLHASVQVINELTNEINFVELYLTQDGTNTFISEYYFDNSNQNSYSGNFIGSFGSDLQSNILSLNFTNTLDTGNVTVKSSIIGFGTADTIGVGSIYRFKNVGSDGSERSAVYISNYQTTTSGLSTSILDINAGLFNCVKSVVEVSAGSTKALHQVMMIHDGVDVYTEQMQFLSVSGISTSDSGVGLGTFGGTFENSGNNFVLKFYPDAGVTQNLSISNLNKCLYQTIDAINLPPDLTYVEGGSILGRESIEVDFFNSLGGTRINRKDFPLTSNGLKIFAREFDPTDNAQISVAGTFTSPNHFFSEGEQLIYTPKSTIVGLAATPMVYKLGGITTSLPSSVFVVNISENTFQISTTRAGTAVTFVSRGSGNSHQFEMAKKNEKTIITIDDVIQYPISFVKSSHQLPIGIGSTSTIFALSGISTVFPRDLLKIDSEYMSVNSVGFGTTSIGPITGIGTTALVEVVRGFVGSSSTSHSSGAQVKVYRGAYNIEGNSIYFSEAPRGNPQIERDFSNLVFQTSEFSGRVFLRKNYDSNVVFDNVSNEFNGIGRTFTLTVGGANTVGLGTTGGNGIVLINGLFQSPTTENNPENNFRIIETTGPSGVTSVVFSSIRPNLDIISQYDINQNEIPRGGIIVSLGSSSGLGYAPLVGASVTAVVGAGGSIVSVGLGTTNIVGSGYNGIVSIGVTVYQEGHVGTAASIMAVVGAGGTLSFTVSIGGTGYTNPKIFVSDPSYENLKVTGVSRIGIGTTTATGLGLLLNVEVGASSTTGIGSTYFEVTGFNITRQGYSFRKGDVFKPVGLVTDRRLANPLSEFTLTVLDTFSDSFAAWQFGNLNYIDSIKNYQDGVRQNFPLYYNGELLSFEKDENSTIDLQNLLLIFINGVLQEPGVSYLFSGGTSFVLTTAPKVEDEISIFFYRGTIGDDSALNDNVYPTLKSGDIVKVHKNNKYPSTISQNNRTVFNLTYSDKFETSLYSGVGIDETFEKPVSWTKQKKDQKINGVFVYKSRSSIETQVYPTARVIKSISPTDQQIFVDNAQFFNYDNTVSPELFDILVINDALSGVGTTTSVGFVELMSGVNEVGGFSGVISGISTSVGIGTSLALRFHINNLNQNDLVGLETGNPIFIYNTSIGSGVTSIDNSNTSVVGVGTTYLDNVYLIHSWSNVVGDDNLGIITCNVHSSSNIIGLTTSGTELNPVGNFSWGKLSGFARSSSPISIGASGNRVDVGLTTFATVHRRGIGLKLRYETGALPKQL